MNVTCSLNAKSSWNDNCVCSIQYNCIAINNKSGICLSQFSKLLQKRRSTWIRTGAARCKKLMEKFWNSVKLVIRLQRTFEKLINEIWNWLRNEGIRYTFGSTNGARRFNSFFLWWWSGWREVNHICHSIGIVTAFLLASRPLHVCMTCMCEVSCIVCAHCDGYEWVNRRLMI